MRARHGWRLALVAVLMACIGAAVSEAALAATSDAPAFEFRAYWYRGRLLVAVQPLANEGYLQFSRRVLDRPGLLAEVRKLNGNRTVRQGVAVHVPLMSLQPALRGQVLRTLYPDDELTEEGWVHTVTDPLESLIQITEAYTGSKRNFRLLAKHNHLKNPDVLVLGTQVVIPYEWIPESLGLQPLALKPPLKLERDAKSGRSFALYAVEPDETLYSLLIRFTDRERADEINRLSSLLMRLNHLKRADRVPTGKTLRIPLEWISAEYIIGKPAAREEVTSQSSPKTPAPGETQAPVPADRVVPSRQASRTALHVIIDPGHGGADPGAVYGSRRSGDLVYEHEVVYDISLRLGRLLDSKGHAVHPLVRSPKQPGPVDQLSRRLPADEQVLVSPPYRMKSVHAAVNLRVYLVDAIYRRLLGQGIPAENILLLSIHGDALAPTLRGAMIYVADYRLRTPEFGPRGGAYRGRLETATPIHYVPQASRAAQQSSLELAQLVLQAFEAQHVRISRRGPIRPYYYREGVRTLPAVLRYSRVPRSILVEVANLNNPDDRRELLQGAMRQRIAVGLAAAVDLYRGRQQDIARR